jgi:hypothetical protein
MMMTTMGVIAMIGIETERCAPAEAGRYAECRRGRLQSAREAAGFVAALSARDAAEFARCCKTACYLVRPRQARQLLDSPGAHLCWVFVEVGLYINTRELRDQDMERGPQ